jgi:hypothetical protein
VVLISDVAVGDEGPRLRDPALGLSAFRSRLYGCFGRRPDYRSVARVFEDEPVPLKIVRNYPPYHEAEKGRPWQNYSETTFGIQRRMADWHFARAESWAELAEAHDRFVRDYYAQEHFAHHRRKDGRRSPSEVLSWVSGMRFHPEDLERAFFSERHTCVLDALGYATLMRWRLYAEEGRAGEEAELWLLAKTLTVEPLSAYEVDYDAEGGRGMTGRLLEVRKPTLFETPFVGGQMRLFGLAEILGEDGWLKALRLEVYALRRSSRSKMLQQVLFAYTDAV